MPEKNPPPGAAEQTRATLLRVALDLFGRQGFDATSTREIATAARANIGSIAYHFGGKQGLRMAAADFIVETIQEIAGPALGLLDGPVAVGPETARRQLCVMMERMVGFIAARPEADAIVQFVLRELSHPSAALDRIYAGVFEPVHRRLCLLFAAATGQDAESDLTKLTVFTLIGQVIYFRIGREAVTRRMGWSGIGAPEASAIVDVATRNLHAILDANKVKAP